MKVRGSMLDERLDALRDYWAGGFEPRPVDRIPVWAAARFPAKPRPLRRAASCDGLFPIDQPDPDSLREMLAAVGDVRGDLNGYDVVVTNPPGTDPAPWQAAGATWCLTGFGTDPTAAEVRAAIAG